MEQFTLKDRVIVVTGGTGILGSAFIKAIANAGGIVGILGRNEMVAEERVSEVIAWGGKAISLLADVLNEQQVIEAKNKLLNTLGRIDGLVNGAGEICREASCSLTGYIRFEYVGNATAETGGGSIINLSGMAAQRAHYQSHGLYYGKSCSRCLYQMVFR